MKKCDECAHTCAAVYSWHTVQPHLAKSHFTRGPAVDNLYSNTVGKFVEWNCNILQHGMVVLPLATMGRSLERHSLSSESEANGIQYGYPYIYRS